METVLRVGAIYLFLMVALRLIGKREFGQLSPFELVSLLLIPEMAGQALVREDTSLANAIIGLSTLILLVFLTSTVTYASRRAARIISGEPTVLVSRGELIPRNMHRERVSEDEIFSEMHKVGLADLKHVRWAILGTDGKISVIPYDAAPKHPAPQRHGLV